jgi:gas vesicle protein GvpK
VTRRVRKPLVTVEEREIASLRAELKEGKAERPNRWNADPEDVQRSVVRLVLALVEFLRKLMERQAIRRMEAGTLTPAQVESIGLSLMKLEETVEDLAAKFGLVREDLNLDLGPLGKLL